MCCFGDVYFLDLTITAPLRTGVNDWSFMWIDVHLGDFACVCVRDCYQNFADFMVAYFP